MDYGIIQNIGAVDLKISGQAQGDILYFNGTDWLRLPAGTANTSLRTNGAGANPAWENVDNATDLSIASQTTGDVLYYNGANWVRLAGGASGDVLSGNGVGVAPTYQTPAGGGGIPTNIQYFTSSGTWVKPADVSTVYVQVWGRGGNGYIGTVTRSGGGGGGGGYTEGLVGVTGNVTVTIGATCSFAGSSTLEATTGLVYNSDPPYGGGTGSGGSLNVTGGQGGPNNSGNDFSGGAGGGGPFGGAGGSGGRGGNGASNAGSIGCFPGGGGGGGGGDENSAGGVGAAGLVIVMY